MAISFTPEQLEVIQLHDCNILVSAAAGSGKTAVLVERIIQMVCDEAHPVDIDRLLIVTFTNAAAAEMRERIANGIADRLQQNQESEHIQRQATLLHNALITTIDSFSLFLIRNHFNEIGLDPAFRVADEGEIKLLQQDVLKELFEESFASENEQFQECVEYFCPSGRERVLEEHILNLSRYAASFPWPSEWLEQRRCDYDASEVTELADSEYGEYLQNHLGHMMQGCVEKMKMAQALCDTPDGPYMYGEMIEGELEGLEKLLTCNSLTEYETLLPAASFGRLPGKRDDSVSPEKKELVKSIRAEVKETIQTMTEKFFATPLALAAKQGQACVTPVNTLIDLAQEFDRRMREKKQEKKIIDFSDMEHYALDILLERVDGEVRPSAVAREYREYFHEILTDEYQDSNLVQEYLLKAVSGEEDGHFNRFMVGDVKQSIYKFRLARPELFLEKYHTYQSKCGERRRIDLAKNFRSRTQVVSAVNDIFSCMMSEEIGGIVYDEAAALYAGATYPENEGCIGELLLIEKPDKTDERNAKEAEAAAIAAKIKEMRAALQVTDKASGLLRPAKYGDMVILLRTNTGWDEVFKKVLEEEGIPVYIASKTGYFAASEVQELLQFLRVLDNPRQDIPLFGVMKSIFGGFSEGEIALIRAKRKNGSLYEALREFAEVQPDVQETECAVAEQMKENGDGAKLNQTDDLHYKVAKFIEMVNHYRDMTVYLPIRDLLQHIVDDFDYLNYVAALPGGSKRQANVEMLFTKASDFEKTSYFGLFHFIRYMEQLEKYDVDYGEAGVLDENADVVRIMSIHKSKGLEFPITFVSGLSKRFNMQDANQSLVVDMDLGLATDYVDSKRRVRNKTLRRNVLSRKMREDNLAEELRVLYVALTRAKEKLIMTATLENAAEKWELQQQMPGERLSYLDFIEAGSYLDFLMPILPKESVKVSVVGVEELACRGFTEQLSMGMDRERLELSGMLTDAEGLKHLREQFAYVYPYRNLAGLYTKTTVSELKIAAMSQTDEAAYHQFEEKELQPYVPAFKRGEEKVSGAVRGSAFHRVMELIDFDVVFEGIFNECPENFPQDYETFCSILGMEELTDGESVKGKTIVGNSQIEQLTESLHAFLKEETASLRLSEEYFEAVNERKIVNFLCSSIAYRMWSADRHGELYREQPFVFGISAKRLSEEFPAEEKVLIQGIIDVFFVEQGKLVLLDYKTDIVSSMDELWNRYSTQLDHYEEALTKLMEMPVGEKVLYSFHFEEISSR